MIPNLIFDTFFHSMVNMKSATNTLKPHFAQLQQYMGGGAAYELTLMNAGRDHMR
jgi:hypothetical protein